MDLKPEAIAAPVLYLRGLAQAVIEKRLYLPNSSLWRNRLDRG